MESINNSFQKNCINLIRIIAAFTVMYGHAVTHLNIHIPNNINKLVMFVYGVPTFFGVSGFLIWKSLEREERFETFFKRRILRIYPELWGSIIINLCVMYFLYENFKSGGVKIALFALAQGTIFQFWTPSFLRDYGCGTPNGSLWTIGVIIQAYFVLFLSYKLLHKRKLVTWIFVIIWFIIISMSDPIIEKYLPDIAFKLYKESFISYYWIFLLGAFITEHFDKIVTLLKKWWFLFLLFSAVFYYFSFDINSGYGILRCSTLILGIIGFSYFFPCLNIKKDISYGVYLYHMIVINAMIQLGYIVKVEYLFVSIILSIVLAYISFSLVGSLMNRK